LPPGRGDIPVEKTEREEEVEERADGIGKKKRR